MAVSTDNAFSGPHSANGVTTVFPFTFKAPTTAEVVAVVRNAIGEDVVPGPYSVSINGGNGGSVTFVDPPAVGLSIIPVLAPAFTQDLQFENGSAWLAEPVNEGYDRSALRDQALKRDVDRALKVPMGNEGRALTTSDRGVVGIFDGQFSVQPLVNVLHEATDLIDDGSWGGSFTTDGAWG